jgi:hypothetical protein
LSNVRQRPFITRSRFTLLAIATLLRSPLLPPAAHLPHVCARVCMCAFPTAPAKQSMTDAIRSSADEICNRNNTETNIENTA